MNAVDPRAVARHLATEHPEAIVACPGCDAGVKGENLARHLEKTHPSLEGHTRWRGLGWLDGELALEANALVLRRFLRFTRTVSLPSALAVGPARVSRADVIDTSLGIANPLHHDERAGTCLHVGGDRGAIVVRCTSGGGARRHWRGWRQAAGTRSWHITLAAGDFAALQHVLASFGMLAIHPSQGGSS